jgi:hypothetical protein
MISVGIDNGCSGAVAAIEVTNGSTPKVILCNTMPITSIGKNTYIDEQAVYDTLVSLKEKYQDIVIGFEIGQRQPIFGTKGNFANGYGYGVIKTVVRLTGIPHIEVNPRTWQKAIFQDIRGADMSTKDASIEYCRRTYPEQTLLPTARCTKKHDGMADALCIASYTSKA